MVEPSAPPFKELVGFVGLEIPDNQSASILPRFHSNALKNVEGDATDLCPAALISFRQRMFIIAPLYEAMAVSIYPHPTNQYLVGVLTTTLGSKGLRHLPPQGLRKVLWRP